MFMFSYDGDNDGDQGEGDGNNDGVQGEGHGDNDGDQGEGGAQEEPSEHLRSSDPIVRT